MNKILDIYLSVLVLFCISCNELDQTIRKAPIITVASSELLADGTSRTLIEIDLHKSLGLDNRALVTTSNGTLVTHGGINQTKGNDSLYISGTESKLKCILISSTDPDDYVKLSAKIGSKETTIDLKFRRANVEELFLFKNFDTLRLSEQNDYSIEAILWRADGRVSNQTRLDISLDSIGFIDYKKVQIIEGDTAVIDLKPITTGIAEMAKVTMFVSSDEITISEDIFIIK